MPLDHEKSHVFACLTSLLPLTLSITTSQSPASTLGLVFTALFLIDSNLARHLVLSMSNVKMNFLLYILSLAVSPKVLFLVLYCLLCILLLSVLSSSPFPWTITLMLMILNCSFPSSTWLWLKHYPPTGFSLADLFLDDCKSFNSKLFQDWILAHHRWRSCASPVLTAIGLVNGNLPFLTPPPIESTSLNRLLKNFAQVITSMTSTAVQNLVEIRPCGGMYVCMYRREAGLLSAP